MIDMTEWTFSINECRAELVALGLGEPPVRLTFPTIQDLLLHLGTFPNHREQIFEDTTLSDITPHVLRHSFANDLGFIEVTIAALAGHATGGHDFGLHSRAA